MKSWFQAKSPYPYVGFSNNPKKDSAKIYATPNTFITSTCVKEFWWSLIILYGIYICVPIIYKKVINIHLWEPPKCTQHSWTWRGKIAGKKLSFCSLEYTGLIDLKKKEMEFEILYLEYSDGSLLPLNSMVSFVVVAWARTIDSFHL